VSIVELDPQALLTIGTHIVKNIVVVFIMMSGERLGPWASCLCMKLCVHMNAYRYVRLQTL